MDNVHIAHPSQSVQEVGEIVGGYLNEMARLFRPGAKLTLLVRRPEKPDGSQDFVLSNDTLAEAAAALTLRQTAPTLKGEV